MLEKQLRRNSLGGPLSRTYHVNPDSGQVSRCKARVACPFGGDQSHYPSPEEARKAYEVMAGDVVRKHSQLHSDFLATEGRLERTYAISKAVRTRILEGRPKKGDLEADLQKLEKLEQEVREGIYEVRDAWYARELAHAEGVEAGLIDPTAQRPNATTKFFRRAESIARRTLRGIDVPFEDLKPAYRLSAINELAAWRGISLEQAEKELDSWDPKSGLALDEHGVTLFQRGDQPHREVYVDLETSSFHASSGEILEIGIVVVEDGQVVKEIAERFDLQDETVRDRLGTGNEAIHKIGRADLIGKRKFTDSEVQKELASVLNDPEAVLIAHHTPFEMAWLSQEVEGFAHVRDPNSAANIRRRLAGNTVALNGDSRSLSSFMLHSTSSNSLECFSQANGVPYEDAHTAIVDARMTHLAHKSFRESVMTAPAGQRPVLTYEGMPPKKVKEIKS